MELGIVSIYFWCENLSENGDVFLEGGGGNQEESGRCQKWDFLSVSEIYLFMALAISSFKIKHYCESEVCLFCMIISNLREITIYMLWKKEASMRWSSQPDNNYLCRNIKG